MKVVLDASVASKWYLREEGSEAALALLERADLTFIAPDLFLAEVANALLKAERDRRVAPSAVRAALDDLRIVGPDLVVSRDLIGPASDIARSANHPIYDCLYLALAVREDTVFVTADEEFRDRCQTRIPSDPAAARLRRMDDLLE